MLEIEMLNVAGQSSFVCSLLAIVFILDNVHIPPWVLYSKYTDIF